MGGETCFLIVQVVSTLGKKRKTQLEQTRTATNATQPRKKNILRDTSIYINVESSPQNFIMQVSSDQLKYMGR